MDNRANPLGVILCLTLVAVFIWRVLITVRNAKATVDPWSAEIDASVHQPDALPLCHRCLTPQERRHEHWFCPECGASVGKYNNYIPYIYIFPQGEVLRAGTSGMIRPSFVNVLGFFLYSLSLYAILAPVYWLLLYKNLKRYNTKPLAASDDNS